jgi:hypothetical protein
MYQPIVIPDYVIEPAYKVFKRKYTTQAVNALNLRTSKEIEPYVKLITYLGIKPSNVIEVVPCRFVKSIPPHEDYSYAKAQGVTKAALVVLNSKRVESKYFDILDASYLYSDKKFTPLNHDRAYRFNLLKEHALMNDFILDTLLIFYKGKDSFVKLTK